MLSVVAQKKWKLNSIDTKAAFLKGENNDRELYVLSPKEGNTDKICLDKNYIFQTTRFNHTMISFKLTD